MSESKQEGTLNRLFELQWQVVEPFVVGAAMECGIFDSLSEGRKSLQDVRRATNMSERGARIVLDALVGAKWLCKEDGRYSLAPGTDQKYLLSSSPYCQADLLVGLFDTYVPPLLELPDIARKGKTTFSLAGERRGSEVFARTAKPSFVRRRKPAIALAEKLDLVNRESPYRVLDIGAGSSVFGVSLAEASPQVRVVAVDRPDVLTKTKEITDDHGVTEQFEFFEGNALEVDLGNNYDLAVLGHVVHIVGESESHKLMQRAYDALVPGGSIAIAEFVPNDERTGPYFELLFPVMMLAMTDCGDAYTFEEIEGWLKATGFERARQFKGDPFTTLILADKPD